MRIEIPCAYCGATLSRTPSRIQSSSRHYCDRICKGKYRSLHFVGNTAPNPRTRVQTNCANCGATMEVTPYRLGAAKSLCCSSECAHKHRIGLYKGENSPTWNGGKVAVSCETCGKLLHRKPYQHKAANNHFCDQQCWGKWAAQNRAGGNCPSWKGGAPVEICDWCGKEYRRFRAKRDAKYTFRFCGRACQAAWQSKYRVGEQCGAWRGGHITYYGPNWGQQKRTARGRDGNKCRHCGKTQKKNGRALDVHHIQPFKTFGYKPDENDYYLLANELTNLITLCKDCHKKAEWQKIPIQPYLL